ncbi:hypothetical protein [Oligoflexus tunisiensis]|uniref:hypothetical protein n=1 Tax=Oligoflexus tunisiensis TaxID=708132 RepID=UPI00114CDAF9|nr:hypothetical protein [Oligoflexus tunisiensis]
MKHRLAFAFFYVMVALGSSAAWASFVEIRQPIASGTGEIAGFTTEDPHLVYMVPRAWTIYRNNIYQNGSSFYFILAPQYDDQTLAQYKLKNPGTIMVPIPHQLSEASLFLGATWEDEFLLGKIRYSVAPDNAVNQSDIIYYNLEVSPDVMPAFKNLLQSSIGINGYLNLSYPFQNTIVHGQIPLFIQSSHIRQTLPDNYPMLWLERLSTEYCLTLDDFMSGKVSLGFQSVTLQSTHSQACWIQDNIQLHALGNDRYSIGAQDGSRANLTARMQVKLVELNMLVNFTLTFTAEAVLDIRDVAVEVPLLQLVSVEMQQGLNPVYERVLRNEVARHNTRMRQAIARTLTQELRSRIINGDLFE